MPSSDHDSSPELSEEPDSPIEEEEEIEEEVEEEEEEEVEEEEEEEEEEEPESIREEEKGDGEEEEAEYEREEEKEVGEEREEAENEEETKDTSKIIDSERHAGDLNLISSIPGMSEPASSNNDITGDCIVCHDPSVKTRAAEDEDSDTRLAEVRSAVQETHISSGGKCCSESLGDQTEVNVSLEKKTSSEDPGNVRNFYLQAHGSGLFDLSPGDTISSKNIAPLQVQDKELVDTTIVKSSSMIGKFNGVLEKEVPPLDRQTDLKTGDDPSLSSLHTAKRRPRSSSPSAIPENSSKKPAITCSFYARGWCIKGSSCRFLHQKEESKEDLPEPSRKGDISDGTGSEREAERSRISSSQERQDPSFSENSSKSPLQMQRALIRAYGGETQGSPHVHGGEEFHRVDIPQVCHTLSQGEHKSPIGVSPRSDHMDEGQPGSEHLLSMRYLHEEKSQRELLKREFLTDSPFSRDSCLAKRSEHRYYSGGSSASSSLYINNNNPFADGRRPDGIAFGGHEGRLPSHGSQSSYGLSGSLNSAFTSSYQPAPGSSFSSESLDIHKTFEFEKACHGFRSASLPRSSPPYSRPAVENGMLRNMRDIPASFRQRMEAQENSWEPSIPFRPSFHYVPPTSSSSGSQYDPLLDSIEPHNAGSILLQSSEKTINVNISDQSIKRDPLLYRSRILEYNMERPLSFFPKPQEGMSDKSKATDGLSRQTSLTATPGHTKVDGGNSSVPKEHPGPLVEGANVNGTEHGSDLRYQVEKSKTTKESKAMKIFRAALVDLVKELVKPAWREGHLSKDAHKTVVKKAVEKVLSALQAHQIPSTTESINQYLSTSRPKISKLVEGYVEKYSKS